MKVDIIDQFLGALDLYKYKRLCAEGLRSFIFYPDGNLTQHRINQLTSLINGNPIYFKAANYIHKLKNENVCIVLTPALTDIQLYSNTFSSIVINWSQIDRPSVLNLLEKPDFVNGIAWKWLHSTFAKYGLYLLKHSKRKTRSNHCKILTPYDSVKLFSEHRLKYDNPSTEIVPIELLQHYDLFKKEVDGFDMHLASLSRTQFTNALKRIINEKVTSTNGRLQYPTLGYVRPHHTTQLPNNYAFRGISILESSSNPIYKQNNCDFTDEEFFRLLEHAEVCAETLT